MSLYIIPISVAERNVPHSASFSSPPSAVVNPFSTTVTQPSMSFSAAPFFNPNQFVLVQTGAGTCFVPAAYAGSYAVNHYVGASVPTQAAYVPPTPVSPLTQFVNQPSLHCTSNPFLVSLPFFLVFGTNFSCDCVHKCCVPLLYGSLASGGVWIWPNIDLFGVVRSIFLARLVTLSHPLRAYLRFENNFFTNYFTKSNWKQKIKNHWNNNAVCIVCRLSKYTIWVM